MLADDEKLVADFLLQRGLCPETLGKENLRSSKTPDFRVSICDALAFFCEVKTIERDAWLDRQLDSAPPGTIVGGARPDPVYNRISAKIHEAVRQFDAVNPQTEYPNVLAFVNHDDRTGWVDLVSVVTGAAPLEGGGSLPIFRKFSHGRIAAERYRVHLYLWISTAGVPSYLVNTDAGQHCVVLCQYFGIDENSIKPAV